MHKRSFIATYRLFFSLLALTAIIAQFLEGLNRPHFSPLNFFHFFTIEANILALATLFIAGVAVLRGKSIQHLASWRGAVTTYMVITGVIYIILLSGLEESLQTATPWINAILHYIMPLVILADWLVDGPGRRITFKQALPWLLFPLGYGLYSLVRGHFIHWYPYPFLNPSEQGYLSLIIGFGFVIPVLVGLTWLTAWTTTLQESRIAGKPTS